MESRKRAADRRVNCSCYRLGEGYKINTEGTPPIKLNAEHIHAIERVLNGHSISEVIVKVEDGTKVVILQSGKKRIL